MPININYNKSYETSDGQLFKTKHDAEIHETNLTTPNTQQELMNAAHKLFTNSNLVRNYKANYDTNLKDVTYGYHSFEKLYEHRRKLSNLIFQTYPQFSWKSRVHSDGEIWDGLFIVGVSIPNVGDYTYHYHTEFWDEFDVKEIEKAPEYDGHTPDSIDRLFELLKFNKNL